jgi:monoamine oxidase
MSTSLYSRLRARYGPPIDLEERRRFLQQTLAVGATLLFSHSALAIPRGFSAKRIVVIGAGFSGLACAFELKAMGYDVTVVEARERIGGRVLSFNDKLGHGYIPGRNVEGGGELIGSNHPTWVAYADKFGLKFLNVSDNEELESPIVLGGKKLDKEECEKVWKDLEATCNGMNDLAKDVDEDEPWKHAKAADLDKQSIASWLKAREMSDHCRAAVSAQLSGDNGVANDKASLLGMLAAVKGGGLDKYWSETEVYRCDGGNEQLARKLAEGLGSRVITGLPAKSIDVKRDMVVVTCADGRTIECDDVVLAVPPSTWKKIAISPALPSSLAPQMGTNVKYLSHVKKRFWEAAKLNGMALTDGDITWAWDATDAQPGDDHACLTAFSGGPAAEAVRAKEAAPRDAAYKAAYESAFPGFGENFVEKRFMDWPSEQWTNAGYSFPAPGQVTTVGPVLRQGIGHLHFAGEHTCYKFVGYMEGGLNSGASLARRLAARDNIIIEPKPMPKDDAKPAEKKEGVGAGR